MKNKNLFDQFVSPEEQACKLGSEYWNVARLFQLAKDLPVMEVPLVHMRISYDYGQLSLREMAGHVLAVQNADLSFPIILDEDGDIMDGRHRLMKAILEGAETIKCVRFDKNPNPCRVDDD